jgi:hypothetical protein
MPGAQQPYGQAPGGYPQQQPQGYGAPPPGMPPGYQAAAPSAEETKGLIAGLLDFSFTNFITTKVLKFLYGLYLVGMGLTVLAGLAAVGMAIINGNILEGLLMLVLLPIAIFLGVIFGRMYFELIIVMFRVAEDLHAIRKNTAKS